MSGSLCVKVSRSVEYRLIRLLILVGKGNNSIGGQHERQRVTEPGGASKSSGLGLALRSFWFGNCVASLGRGLGGGYRNKQV